jgi:hypothetical protein
MIIYDDNINCDIKYAHFLNCDIHRNCAQWPLAMADTPFRTILPRFAFYSGEAEN